MGNVALVLEPTNNNSGRNLKSSGEVFNSIRIAKFVLPYESLPGSSGDQEVGGKTIGFFLFLSLMIISLNKGLLFPMQQDVARLMEKGEPE